MPHAIVTGGEGFIGRALVSRLLGAGYNVTVIDDYSTHDRAVHSDYPESVRLITAPVQEVAPRWKDVDVIFHLAGKVGPVGVLRWKGRIAHDTITANSIVGDWAYSYDCPLIDISTSEIYGSPDRSNSEDDPKVFPYPASARMEYAVAKLAAETMLLNRDINVKVVRPFNVAGPEQRPDGGFVLPRFVKAALDNKVLTVYAPGTQKRSFTHIDDFIDGLILVYTKGRKGSVYNIGNPYNECSMIQLALEVQTTVGAGSIEVVNPVEMWGDTFKEAADKVPDADKAMNELGWNPVRTRQMLIDDTVAYWRDH